MKQFLIILLLCNSLYSMDCFNKLLSYLSVMNVIRIKNSTGEPCRLKQLPKDVQKYLIDNFLTSDEELIQILNNDQRPEQCEMFHHHNGNIFAIRYGDLVQGNLGNLTTLTFGKMVDRFSFTSDDEIKNELKDSFNSIHIFAISPNKQYLVGLQVLQPYCANGIWIIDLLKNKSVFKSLPNIFSQHFSKVPRQEVQPYVDQKEYLALMHKKDCSYVYLPFQHVAISNEGIVALNSRHKILFLKPNQAEPFKVHEFDVIENHRAKCPRGRFVYPEVSVMKFNDEGSKLGVKYKKASVAHDDKEVIELIQVKEIPETFNDYFLQRIVCKN